jgi:hypothetical protein
MAGVQASGERLVALQENDLAILTARFGCARFGASRFGFIPCPEDVHGSGAEEPGEYIWKEVKPPTTAWQLITEDCVCGQAPVALFSMTGVEGNPGAPPAILVPVATSTVNGTVTYDAPGGPFAWPAINVEMTVDGIPWPGGDAITDALGYYEFLLVPAGAIDVSVDGIAPAVGQRLDTNSGVTVPPATLTLDLYGIGI